MASESAMESPFPSLTASLKTMLPDVLPSKCPPIKAISGTPPSTPVADATVSHMAVAPIIPDIMPVVAVLEPLQLPPWAVKSKIVFEHREIVEHSQSTTPEAVGIEVEAAKTKYIGEHTTTQLDAVSAGNSDLFVTTTQCETGNEDGSSVDRAQPIDLDATAASNETCGSQPEEPASVKRLLAANKELSVTSEVYSSEEKGDQHEVADDIQTDSRAGQNESFVNDEYIVLRTQNHATTPSAPPRSVPPHMRPTFKAPNPQQTGSREAKHERPVPVTLAPRAYYPSVGYQPAQPPLDYSDLQRTKAQLMKARSDLEIERKINAANRKTVGAENQAGMSAAMSVMLTDLLQKQADALVAKAEAQEKVRDLQYREQRITQFEDYLSAGQKQLKHQLEQQGIRSMNVVDESNLRLEVELKVKHQLSDIEGKIATQVERLRHQEAAQKIREQQYKILVRDAIENEIEERFARDIQAKAADTTSTEAAYERGLADGKNMKDEKASEEETKQKFLSGYAACYRSQTALHNMRNGHIAADSPEIAFLYDPTCAENPHNIGLSIGRMEAAAGSVEPSTVSAVISRRSLVDATRAAAVTGKSQTVSDNVAQRGHDQIHSNNVGPFHTFQAADRSVQVHTTHQIESRQTQQVQQVQLEEPVRRSVPSRPTFAGELRGPSSTVASKAIFASGSYLQSTTNSVPGASTAGRMGEGVYAGRRVIRYEDSDGKTASPNLIDLY